MSASKKTSKKKKKSKSTAPVARKVRKVKRSPKRKAVPAEKVRQGKNRKKAASSGLYTVAMPRADFLSAIRVIKPVTRYAPTPRGRSGLFSFPGSRGLFYVGVPEWWGTRAQAAALAARLSLMLSYVRGRAARGFAPTMPEVVRVPALPASKNPRTRTVTESKKREVKIVTKS